MRYDRVQSILDSVPALKEFLGPKDQEIVKRNKEKHYYSRGVVIVTHALHSHGHDAHNAPRAVVLQLAVDLLRDKKQATKVVEKPKTKPEPKPEPTQAEVKPEPRTERKPSVETKPKAEPKKQVKPASKAKPAKPEPAAAAPALPQPTPQPPAAVAPPIATTPAADQKSGYVYYPYGTALSLALMLYKALEIGDRLPGAEGRLEHSSKMIDMLKPLASAGIPMPEDFDAALNHDKGTNGKS